MLSIIFALGFTWVGWVGAPEPRGRGSASGDYVVSRGRNSETKTTQGVWIASIVAAAAIFLSGAVFMVLAMCFWQMPLLAADQKHYQLRTMSTAALGFLSVFVGSMMSMV